MATHLHFHSHARPPIRGFVWEHPYAGDWLILALGTLAALLLWYWNSGAAPWPALKARQAPPLR